MPTAEVIDSTALQDSRNTVFNMKNSPVEFHEKNGFTGKKITIKQIKSLSYSEFSLFSGMRK